MNDFPTLGTEAGQPPPTSEPVIQQQPDALQYGEEAIALFRPYTREGFEEEWDVQPPAFDPSRPIQFWFDTTAPGQARTYKKLTRDGLVDFTVPARERATPNLPGKYRYPKPYYAATDAYQESPGGRREPIVPHLLTTLDEADQLCREIQGQRVEESQMPMFPYVYPPHEKRRIHTVVRNGQSYPAWRMRSTQTSHGVGAPGHWDLSDPDCIRWSAGPFPDGKDCKLYKAVPVRDLLPNEKVETIFGGLTAIRRTDVGPADGFTAADRQKLDAIYRKLLPDG